MSRAALIVVSLAACSGESAPPPPSPPPPVVPVDAAPGITTISGFDPASGMHLDDDSPAGKPAGAKKQSRQGPPIGLMLKSTPSGATIFIDGQHFGVTPKYWSGVADGSDREFAFALPKYALARYRFVPITSGTIHATLQRAESGETLDAGLRPQIAPTFAPDAALAPPPVIAPAVDAAPAPAPVPAPADAAGVIGPAP